MEVICDTNIWYGLGNELIDKSLIKEGDKLIATYISIDELAYTPNLIKQFNRTQNAIRAMLKYSSKHAIIEPPFVYLKVISDKEYFYDVSYHGDTLRFLERIANGHNLNEEFKSDFEKESAQRKDSHKTASDFFNQYAQENIKPNIKDKQSHRKENSIPLNREFIEFLVRNQTNSDQLKENLDWSQIELFEKVLKLYFNEIETGAKISTQNDWFDLFLLIYVNPKRKLWTQEKYWIKLIKEAGLTHYLYENAFA